MLDHKKLNFIFKYYNSDQASGLAVVAQVAAGVCIYKRFPNPRTPQLIRNQGPRPTLTSPRRSWASQTISAET